jgi:mRNA interferase RelE/StbE
MSYAVTIRREAARKLQSLNAKDRARITEKIVILGDNPDDPGLDAKRLAGEPHYRLRVVDWRVIYERQDKLRIISIEKIKPRGDAYK